MKKGLPAQTVILPEIRREKHDVYAVLNDGSAIENGFIWMRVFDDGDIIPEAIGDDSVLWLHRKDGGRYLIPWSNVKYVEVEP